MVVSLQQAQTWHFHTKLYKLEYRANEKTAETWFLARLFIHQLSFTSQILDFIHWMVTTFSFHHTTGENRELLKSRALIIALLWSCPKKTCVLKFSVPLQGLCSHILISWLRIKNILWCALTILSWKLMTQKLDDFHRSWNLKFTFSWRFYAVECKYCICSKFHISIKVFFVGHELQCILRVCQITWT